MSYFEGIRTLEELKKEYYRLASILHPDKGGDVEEMKALNAEYDECFEKVKDFHLNKDGNLYEKSSEEVPEAFRTLINELIGLNNITVEVIGSFIWVSGETYPYRAKLKELGLSWHPKKKCWYRSPSGYRKHSSRAYELDEIREMYGVKYTMSESYEQINLEDTR